MFRHWIFRVCVFAQVHSATNFAICAGSITRCSDNASHCARTRSQAPSNCRLMKRYLPLALAGSRAPNNGQALWNRVSWRTTNVERRQATAKKQKQTQTQWKWKVNRRVWSERIDRMEMHARARTSIRRWCSLTTFVSDAIESFSRFYLSSMLLRRLRHESPQIIVSNVDYLRKQTQANARSDNIIAHNGFRHNQTVCVCIHFESIHKEANYFFVISFGYRGYCYWPSQSIRIFLVAIEIGSIICRKIAFMNSKIVSGCQKEIRRKWTDCRGNVVSLLWT